MTALPASIEAALEEAGFSSTELLILKRLLEDDAMTLRQLALKTGKSTGVLDQAMKKLLKKRIVMKEEINETPKYTIGSLQAIVQWMEQDTRQKRELLLRKYENFESFIASISVDRHRPDLKHFAGEEGMQQAYVQLLQRDKEILQYVPATMKEEDDALREFKVQWFRMRRAKGVFSRVLAPDTSLGRRYQSRDAFEYRKTVLIKDCPILFEKIISGNVVACFDHQKQSACFINYPALAEAERSQFEARWVTAQGGTPAPAGNATRLAAREPIPLRTQMLSQLREFFLSRTSLITFAILAIVSAAATYGLYRYTVHLNTQRLREKVMSIAATGALQFEAEELDQLRTMRDVGRPEYAMAVAKLNLIRAQNPSVRYAYIMRKTGQGEVFEFVADADSLNPNETKDVDLDGDVDFEDDLSFPGEKYDAAASIPKASLALIQPISFEPYSDKWGFVISGWAPIGDKQYYILGIDTDPYQISNPTYLIILYIVLWIIFIFAGFLFFNRQLLSKEIFIFRKILDRKL